MAKEGEDIQPHVSGDSFLDVLDKVLSETCFYWKLTLKVKEREIYLAHMIQVTIPDDGHLQDLRLGTTVMWMIQTHIEPRNVEVLLELAKVGTTKEFRIHGKSKRKETLLG